VYSTDHPYGRSATEESIKSITRDDVVAFHRQFFQPSRAIITVVGDVKADDVRRMVERVAAPWSGGGARGVAFTFEVHYPAPPAPKSTTIYLVDKPEAAQSSFSIGGVGPARNTPDYFALRVMNALFGELFQSRLNANIREQKGYSYGVFSSFAFGRGPGAYRASGDIVTAKTDSALVEFMKEIRGIRGERALTDDEMEQAKNSLVQRLPSRFSSVSGVGGSIASLYVQGLPDDYYQNFAQSVNAVTKDDVVRVARKYIDPDHLAIVIVGDRKEIQRPIEALKIAPIVLLDINGNPISNPIRP
jgi:zinc protease